MSLILIEPFYIIKLCSLYSFFVDKKANVDYLSIKQRSEIEKDI